MTTLEQNLNKSLRTKGGGHHDNLHVADVYVNPDTVDNMLTQAYMLSQNISNIYVM